MAKTVASQIPGRQPHQHIRGSSLYERSVQEWEAVYTQCKVGMSLVVGSVAFWAGVFVEACVCFDLALGMFRQGKDAVRMFRGLASIGF